MFLRADLMGFVWNRTIPIAELLLLLLLCMQSVLDCVPVHSDFSHTALASPPTKCVSIVFISSASLLHILIFIGGFYAGNHHDDVSPMQMTAPNNSECYSLHIELYTEPKFCVVRGFSHFQLYCITFVDGKVRFFQNVTHSWTPAPIQNAFDVFISMKYICSVLFWCCVFWVGFCLGSFVIKNSSSSSSYFCIRCQFEAI